MLLDSLVLLIALWCYIITTFAIAYAFAFAIAIARAVAFAFAIAIAIAHARYLRRLTQT